MTAIDASAEMVRLTQARLSGRGIVQRLSFDGVSWEKEFRCFAAGGKVPTASVYLRDGLVQTKTDYPSEPEELPE